MQTIESILEHCFKHRLDRKSLLVAFGGGVIGDMTGFAAYYRDWETDRKSTRLNSSHRSLSRMPSSA